MSASFMPKPIRNILFSRQVKPQWLLSNISQTSQVQTNGSRRTSGISEKQPPPSHIWNVSASLVYGSAQPRLRRLGQAGGHSHLRGGSISKTFRLRHNLCIKGDTILTSMLGRQRVVLHGLFVKMITRFQGRTLGPLAHYYVFILLCSTQEALLGDVQNVDIMFYGELWVRCQASLKLIETHKRVWNLGKPVRLTSQQVVTLVNALLIFSWISKLRPISSKSSRRVSFVNIKFLFLLQAKSQHF